MYSASLMCVDCFATFVAHGSLVEVGSHRCPFCGNQLEEYAGVDTGLGADDAPVLVVEQSPAIELLPPTVTRRIRDLEALVGISPDGCGS